MARRSYPVGSRLAKVTSDLDEAARTADDGQPVVLVGKDAEALGEAVAAAPDQGRSERLLAVVVGDPDDPAVMLAAEEMAGELWQWASAGGPAPAGVPTKASAKASPKASARAPAPAKGGRGPAGPPRPAGLLLST